MLFMRIVSLLERCFFLYLEVIVVVLGMLKLKLLIWSFVLVILFMVFVKDCLKFWFIKVMCMMFFVLYLFSFCVSILILFSSFDVFF